MKPRCELCGRTNVALAIDFDGGSRGVRECQGCFDRQSTQAAVPAHVHPRPFDPETDRAEPVVLWWVSFAAATGFLGVVVVPGSPARLPPDASFEGALLRPAESLARLLGCHPGGDSAVGYPLTDEQADRLDDSDIARLLSREEAEALLTKLGEASTPEPWKCPTPGCGSTEREYGATELPSGSTSSMLRCKKCHQAYVLVRKPGEGSAR